MHPLRNATHKCFRSQEFFGLDDIHVVSYLDTVILTAKGFEKRFQLFLVREASVMNLQARYGLPLVEILYIPWISVLGGQLHSFNGLILLSLGTI